MAVTGGTGFVGAALVRALLADGHAVSVLSRGGHAIPTGARLLRWDDPAWPQALGATDAVVHLAGASIAAQRWTAKAKAAIRDSRVDGTRALIAAFASLPRPPALLISASAVGYYGPQGDAEVTEDAAAGGDYLAAVCVAWEAEAQRAEALGVRVALLRTGLVLGPAGGALPRLALPFRLWAGGPLGSGRQWVPWIHRDDVVGIVRLLLGADGAAGPFNVTGPQPVTNLDFSRALGRVLHRPCWARLPAAALRLALGEMADALLLGGQRAVPARVTAMGYAFRYPDVDGALRAALSPSAPFATTTG